MAYKLQTLLTGLKAVKSRVMELADLVHIFRSNSRYTEFKNAGVGAKQFVFQKPSWRFRRMLKSGNHCSKKGQLS